jgi:hypothetical protein
MIRKNKKAQITIFVIIALIIVGVIILVFILWRRPTITIAPTENPEAYIQECLEDYTKEVIDILSANGGDLVPEGSLLYGGKNITYLCYTSSYYNSCVNQRPMLIEHMEDEISNYLEPRMRACFVGLKEELEERNYVIEYGGMEITTDLRTKKVVVEVDRKLLMTKNEETRSFDKFKAQISSPIYDLARVAMEIANQEAQFCNFELVGFMVTYPRWDIEKFRTGDSDNVYTIREVSSGKEFIFATRSCAMPPGF